MPFVLAPKPEQQAMYDYLEQLRLSGRVNMFGARPYLEAEFHLDSKTAKEVLVAWMKANGKHE